MNKLLKLLVFESVASTQEPGCDSAPQVWWHFTETAEYTVARFTLKEGSAQFIIQACVLMYVGQNQTRVNLKWISVKMKITNYYN